MTPHDPGRHTSHPQTSPLPMSGADKNGEPPGHHREDLGSDLPTYEPVRPRKSVTLSVSYRVRGRGRPLPYALDAGESE